MNYMAALPQCYHKLYDGLRLYDSLRLYDDPGHEFHDRFRLCASLPYSLRQSQAPRTPMMIFEDKLKVSALPLTTFAERLRCRAPP